jgi:CubicO group peptidase (beta-lactamase class C family)
MKTGMHPGKLAEIPKRMEQFVAEKQISGAVTLVAHHGEIQQLAAVGESDIANHRKMRTDDMFWIASMTKPMTAVAVMMLQDEGKLSVDDPVEKHLPEFKNEWMVDAKSKDEMKLVRPPRAITIRDLLTHTSGLGDVSAPRPNCSLAELIMAYSQAPLNFPPGSKWSYCNSGINTLGRIVEVVSGMGFAEFLQKRLFDPLDMDDTTFWPSKRQVWHVAKSYQPGTNGLAEADVYFVKGPLIWRERTPFPAGGLYSTARDVSHFYQMMLNGGTWHGKQLLKRETVTEMTRTQTGDIKTGFTDGASWGYGFCVVKEPQGVTRMLSPGSFGHGGAYGTQSWADPKRDLIMVLMIQRAKLPNADASPMREALQENAVSAVAH